MENLKSFKIHSINQEAYIFSSQEPFHIFLAALVFPAIQFDISFFGFQVVGYQFRADQSEICNLTIHFSDRFFRFHMFPAALVLTQFDIYFFMRSY